MNLLVYPVVVDRDDKVPAASLQHAAELQQLRETVEDLTAQIRDLEDQLAAVLRARDAGGTAVLASGPAGEPVVPGSPPVRGPTAALKRTAKRAIRGSLGVARLVWGAADPAQRHVVAVRPGAKPVPSMPQLTVVVEGTEIPTSLVHQTLEDLEIALWDRTEGTLASLTLDGVETTRATVRNRDDILGVIGGDYIMTFPPAAPSLSASLMERLQWLVASERPHYVRVVDGGSVEDADLRGFQMLCSRDVWEPESSPALDRLGDVARTSPMLGLTVGIADELDATVPRLGSLGPGSQDVVCRTGRFDVWAKNRTGPVVHEVSPLPEASDPIPEDDNRPTVIMVAATSLDGGYEQLAAGVVSSLIDDVRLVVATTAADHGLGLRRSAQIERTGALVFELGSVLDPSVWPSAVDRLVSRFDPSTVLVLGSDDRLSASWSALENRGRRLVHLGGHGAGTAGLPPGWPFVASPDDIQPQRLLEVRAEVGVPVDRFLVVTAIDLVQRTRPEDVVTVADRLRNEQGLEFLLVGEGPLEAHLVDLMRYLERVNVRLRRPRHGLHELVAAADLVFDPSEDAAVRPAVVAAAAVGTPVVTTTGGGVETLFPSSGPAGLVVDEVGDTKALADAILEVRRRGWTAIDPESVREDIRRLASSGREGLRETVLGSLPSADGS